MPDYNSLIEHHRGDATYYISYGQDGWHPEIREASPVKEIHITENGVEYYDAEGCELETEEMRGLGQFWTKEDAQKWMDENIPQVFRYAPEQEVYVASKYGILTYHCPEEFCLTTMGGKLGYVMEASGSTASITVGQDGVIMEGFMHGENLSGLTAHDTEKQARKEYNAERCSDKEL